MCEARGGEALYVVKQAPNSKLQKPNTKACHNEYYPTNYECSNYE